MEYENKTIITKKIINRIISKGGVYAEIAKICSKNAEQSIRFIIECAKPCHSNIAELYWGDDLTKEIKTYKNKFDK